MKENTAPAQNTDQQPLFYKNPLPLLIDRHKDAGFKKDSNYNFAKPTNSVPVNVQEFGEVCKHYPIVFTGNGNPMPVAILGLEDKKNLFVNKSGEWKSSSYIPAYVRRYPFAFTVASDRKDALLLCIDEGSERYEANSKKGMKFFEDGAQSLLTKNALAFCEQYHRDYTITENFAKELLASGLLIERQVNVNLESSKKISLGGFRVVDEEKFLNLDEKKVLEWHKNGVLALINIHHLSGSNWQKLSEIHSKNS